MAATPHKRPTQAQRKAALPRLSQGTATWLLGLLERVTLQVADPTFDSEAERLKRARRELQAIVGNLPPAPEQETD